jgi:hypothetical protein
MIKPFPDFLICFRYDYDPSYIRYSIQACFITWILLNQTRSHAHGWSTGPNSALTFYVLGLTPITPQGQTWSVAPHLSGLFGAQGGFQTPLGWFGVNWTLNDQSSSTATVNIKSAYYLRNKCAYALMNRHFKR